ncbi:hypothetical protein ISCGN_027182 [Ixodes scapularis]
MRRLLVACETKHHEGLRKSSVSKRNILRRRSLWSCDRYIVTRELWKAVAVPGLTFGNSVICVPSELRTYLERRQREVGRQALGCHGQVANELIEGDVGWSSFEEREANSKLQYYTRLRYMNGDRWARRVFMCIHLHSYINSTSRKRVARLGTRFKIFSLATEPQTEKEWMSTVREEAKRVERDRWMSGMLQHPPMHMYESLKTEIAPVTFCGNTLGSRLLIEARGGALRTRIYRSKYDSSVIDKVCSACGAGEETIDQLLLACRALNPTPRGCPLVAGTWFHQRTDPCSMLQAEARSMVADSTEKSGS